MRNLAADPHSSVVATVLALHRNAVSTLKGFRIVPMLDHGGPFEEAARLLEIFLDRIPWKAATEGPASNSYLLHPNYQDLFDDDPATMRLRGLLSGLADKLGTNDPVCDSMGWKQVAELLERLGGQAGERRTPAP